MGARDVPEAWCPTVPAGDAALFLRIARAVSAEIRAGRLMAGERLPGARVMAARLGVHRHTVAAAWRELAGEGWVTSTPRGGVRVARVRPLPTPVSGPPQPAFPLPEPAPRRPHEVDAPGRVVLHGGRPDLRLLPLRELGRAWRRVVAGHGRALVDYGDPRGNATLREALGAWLREHRGLDVRPERLLITRGAQQALHLAARACLRPGQRIGVEAWGYPAAWAAFELAGVTCVPIDVDAEGIDVSALARADVDAVYVTPHHQYPTMVGLSPDRRSALLAFATARRIPVFEDDYDHEFHFIGRPRLPLAHADAAGVVLYIGTLSKALAPGLRIGFVVGPPEVLGAMTGLRQALDRQGDAVTERAVAELLLDGELDRHLARTRRVYAERGRTLARLVRTELGVDQPDPEGGLALWVRSPAEPAALRRACEAKGVSFRIGDDHRFDGRPDPHLRLGYSNLDEDELARAMRVVGETARALPR